MAHQTRLTRWLVENRQALNLKICSMDWSRYWTEVIFDFEVALTIGGKVFNGRGTDTIEEIALEKASSEAVERAICRNLKISTKGVAVHTDMTSATENSRLEALERQLLAWHISSKAVMSVIDDSSLSGIKLLKSDGLVGTIPQFFKMAGIAQVHSVTCLIQEAGQKFFGVATGYSENRAARKALIEASRNLFAYRRSPDEFLKTISGDRNFWCANNEYLSQLPLSFDLTETSLAASPAFEFNLQVISSSDFPGLIGCPAVLARTTVKGAVA